MARPVLGSLVKGVRGLLSAQLFVSILAIALAGWTLTVTSGLIRERDRLRERVIQLEASMAERGIVVPPTPAVVESAVAGEQLYPGPIPAALRMASEDESALVPLDTSSSAEAAERSARIDFSQVLTDLFAPAPPMRLVVLHVRDAADASQAQRIGEELRRVANVHVVVDVLTPRDPSQSGYIYFDGRQNRPTADLVTQFHDIARSNGIAPWSAQLRGAALPAQGEYTPDRLDIVLPPLPPPPPPAEPVAAAPAPG